jgi:hypothetical protein
MKSQYLLKRKEHYLYFLISGEFDKMDFLSYPMIILNECKKEDVYKVLFDALELKGSNPSTMDRFFVGDAIANTLGNKIKLAVAWPGKDINKFCENVATNRGSRVCVLDNIDAAENWLLDTRW